MKIITFAGSNSQNSINRKLANHAASFFNKSIIEKIDLNDYEVAIYGIDKETANGIPEEINSLASKIDDASLLIISLAEHNGSYSSAFKNIYDWLSRIPNRKVFGEKPVFLLATSPGARGGSGVLNLALDRFPRDGSAILESFSLPSFYENFKEEEISTHNLRFELIQKVNNIKKSRFNWL